MEIDRETLAVRIYADSVEDLREVACPVCAHYETCDKVFAGKPCAVPCG